MIKANFRGEVYFFLTPFIYSNVTFSGVIINPKTVLIKGKSSEVIKRKRFLLKVFTLNLSAITLAPQWLQYLESIENFFLQDLHSNMRLIF